MSDSSANTPKEPERSRSAWARLGRFRDAAVRLDSEARLIEGIERLRRRLPGDERFGDSLSTEGRRPVNVVARGVSALDPGRESALHELGLGALQVWQSVSEASGRGLGERPVALLFTDLVDFSPWALEVGDTASVDLLREVGEVLEGAIEQHDGAIVKRLGDGLMAAFERPQPAVEAALDAFDALERISVDGYSPRMRAGVHHGRPRRLGGDYLGVDVNIAARVGGAAKAEQLLVSEPACELLDPAGLELGRARRLKQKGAPHELRVRAVARAQAP